MAQLDVSEALTDPLLGDTFTVRRKVETLNSKGRAILTPTDIPRVFGVITVSSPNDLERLPEEQRMGRHLSIVTKFQLIGPAPGKQPDSVLWRGSELLVQNVEPYPQFGQGFMQAIVGSTDMIDPES